MDEDDNGEAVGLGWSDPLGIMGSDPAGGANYFPVVPRVRECTCPRPGRRALIVVHGADPFEDDPEHECVVPRPRVDWREVLDGLRVWRR